MKGTVNGKSLDQVLSELKAPFPEEELKKNEKNETYIPVESLESRLNSVIGVLNYDTLVTYEGIQEVLGRFVVVAKTILIIYDDERNALIRKSALGGSNIIVVKDTGKPSSLKTDIAAAQSESFKNVCKLLQIGISQIRSGKQRRGQNGTKQRREEKNFIKIIYVFLTIFLYLLKCPQSLILSALRAFCFCGKPHISRSIFLYFRYQAWLKSW